MDGRSHHGAERSPPSGWRGGQISVHCHQDRSKTSRGDNGSAALAEFVNYPAQFEFAHQSRRRREARLI